MIIANIIERQNIVICGSGYNFDKLSHLLLSDWYSAIPLKNNKESIYFECEGIICIMTLAQYKDLRESYGYDEDMTVAFLPNFSGQIRLQSTKGLPHIPKDELISDYVKDYYNHCYIHVDSEIALSGRMASGKVNRGNYLLLPNNDVVLISSVELFSNGMGMTGDNVGLLIKGKTKQEMLAYKQHHLDILSLEDIRDNKIKKIIE